MLNVHLTSLIRSAVLFQRFLGPGVLLQAGWKNSGHRWLLVSISQAIAMDWIMHLPYPSKLICWIPNPQGDGVWRWSLWEIIGSNEVTKRRPWWWNKSPYKKRHQGLCSLSAMWHDSEQKAMWKPEREPLLEINLAGILILNFYSRIY